MNDDDPICARCDCDFHVPGHLEATKYCHDCAQVLVMEYEEKLPRLQRAFDAVMGHGFSLPAAGGYSDEFRRGYEKGVGSQRRAAKEAFEEDDD